MVKIVFFVVFFEDCFKYNGPHTKKCLESIWNMTKCTKSGTDYPSKFTSEVSSYFALQNIRYACGQYLEFVVD